jgi:hypothetical protein
MSCDGDKSWKSGNTMLQSGGWGFRSLCFGGGDVVEDVDDVNVVVLNDVVPL